MYCLLQPLNDLLNYLDLLLYNVNVNFTAFYLSSGLLPSSFLSSQCKFWISLQLGLTFLLHTLIHDRQ